MRAQTPVSLSVPLVYLERSPSCFARTRTTVREDETNGWMDKQMDGWVDGRTCHTDLSWLTDCFRGGFVGVVGGQREACEPVCVSGVQRTCGSEMWWMEQLSEWNNQSRIKRPLVLYAGTTDDGRSSKYFARRQPEQWRP